METSQLDARYMLTFCIALLFFSIAPSMFLSDYAYNRGLRHTTVASCTVLVSTSSVFVLFLSSLLQMEKFSYVKFLAVILTVIGTALTTITDAQQDEQELAEIASADVSENDETMLYGDMWSLIAAVGYAAYSIQARLLCPENEELYSMSLLLGYVGLISAIPLLPMGLYKIFDAIDDVQSLLILCLKGLLDFVVSDFLLFKAVLLTNATVANVGLGLTIPLAFLADYVVHQASFTPLQYMGAGMILTGFVVVNLLSDGIESIASDSKDEDSQATPKDATNQTAALGEKTIV